MYLYVTYLDLYKYPTMVIFFANMLSLMILKKNDKAGKPDYEELISTFATDVTKRRKKQYGRAEAIAVVNDMVRKLGPYGIASEVLQVVDANSMSFMSLDRIVRNVESLQ